MRLRIARLSALARLQQELLRVLLLALAYQQFSYQHIAQGIVRAQRVAQGSLAKFHKMFGLLAQAERAKTLSKGDLDRAQALLRAQVVGIVGEAPDQLLRVDRRALDGPQAHRAPIGVLVDRLVQRVAHQASIVKREDLPASSHNLIKVFLGIRLAGLMLAHDLLNRLVVLLHAPLKLVQGQSLDGCTLVAQARQTPLALLLQDVDGPEPVATGLFVDRRAHRHLRQGSAERRVGQLQRPTHLDLFGTGGAGAQDGGGEPETRLAALLALGQEVELEAHGMSLVGPSATQLDPFRAAVPLQQRTLAGQQVVTQAVVAHCPGPGEVRCHHIWLHAPTDKGQAAILAYLARVQDQALHQRKSLAKVLVRLRLAPAIDIQSLIKQATGLGQRAIDIRGMLLLARPRLGHASPLPYLP